MRPPNFGRGFRRTSGGISRIVKELVPGSFNIFGMFFSLSVEFLKLSFFSRSLRYHPKNKNTSKYHPQNEESDHQKNLAKDQKMKKIYKKSTL